MSASQVEAELASLKAWVTAGLTFMLVSAVTGLLSIVWIASHQSQALNTRIAESNQALACYISDQLDSQEKSISTVVYYQEHPEERVAALKDIKAQRARAVSNWGGCEGSK